MARPKIVENSENTVDSTGWLPQELVDSSQMMTEAVMISKFYSGLIKGKVGTRGVEKIALKLVNDKKCKEGITVDDDQLIMEGRESEMVVDVLKIKLKYARKREKGTRKKYGEELRKMERSMKRGSGKWRRMMEKLSSLANKKWEKLKLKYDNKTEHLKETYNEEISAEVCPEEDEEAEELLRGIALSDEELEKREEGKNEVVAAKFGHFEEELDEDEEAVIGGLNPKFAVFDKLCLLTFKQALEAAKTKIRWERRRNDKEKEGTKDDKTEKKTKEEERIEREMEMIELKTRMIYDQDDNELDMRRRLATDIKTNQRVIMPQARPAGEEAELLVRFARLEKVFVEYVEKHCDEKGNQKESNLTEKERRGMKKLQKRVKNKEVVINTTDKSGRLCINTMQSYVEQGRKHVGNDRKITWEEVVVIQRRATAHARVVVKIFNVGEDWGEKNMTRVRGAYSTQSGVVPVLSTLPKDHKPYVEGVPKTRRRQGGTKPGILVTGLPANQEFGSHFARSSS